MIKGILGGLKFSILGFFWLGKLSKYFSFFGTLVYIVFFWGGGGGGWGIFKTV